MDNVTLQPMPAGFNPFAGGATPAGNPNANVSPDVQRERDQVRMRILQQEAQDNPDDTALQKEIGFQKVSLDGGQPFGPPSRGSKISTELKAAKQPEQSQVALQPMPEGFDPFAAPAKPQTFVGKLAEAAKTGAVKSFTDLQDSANALINQNVGSQRPPKEYEQPLTWGDLIRPGEALPKAVYQLAHGAPVLAAGVAGGVAGAGAATAAAGPEAAPVGAIAGGSLGAGAMAVAQAIGPRFAEELKASPNDPDAAFSRAAKKAATDGAFTAVGWAAFGFAPFEGAIKNLLFQAFGVQPAVTAASVATFNAQEGKPLTEGVVESIPGAVVGTVLPAAGLHAARVISGGHAEPPAVAPRPEVTGAPAGEAQSQAPPEAAIQPAPSGPIPADAPLPILYPKSPTYTSPPEEQPSRLNPSPEAIPYTPSPPWKVSPLEQARADAEILKKGGIPQDADDTRLRNASLVAVYGENAAVRHAIEAPELTAIGDAMLRIAPKVEQVRKTLQAGQQDRDITTDIMTAIDEIARMKAAGLTVDQVMAHGLPHEVSFEGQQLIRFLDENAQNPQILAQFMENYLQQVQDMGGVPSAVRGRAFDILAERTAAKKSAEEAAARTQVGEAADKQQKSDLFRATEQAKAENLLTELAKARAAGSGVNPEYQTAMEAAFANAKPLKGKANGKSDSEKPSAASAEPVREGKGGAADAGTGQGESPAEQRAQRVPVGAEPGEPGNTRPVGEDVGAQGAETDTGKRGLATQIATELKGKPDLKAIQVKTNAIEAETGRRVQITERADVALKGLDHQIQTMQALMECLG